MAGSFSNGPNDWLFLYTAFHTVYESFEKKISEWNESKRIRNIASTGSLVKSSRNFLYVFRGPIFILCASIILFTIQSHSSATSSSAEKVTREEPVTLDIPTSITSWPIKRSTKDSWLDELDPILDEESFCYIDKWNKFDRIKVDGTIYPHSIGICIPLKDQQKYINLRDQGQITHSEYLEYRLGYKYQTFQFDYGIDDLSFPDGVKSSPMCQFRIVVQQCNSKDYVRSEDTPLFDTEWTNYRCCAHRSPELDVSGCEAIRITVSWQFNIQQNGPIALQVALFNSILRAAKIPKYQIN